MTDEAIDAVARLLARRVGLRLDHAIRARLVSAVRDEADRRGQAIDDYRATLDQDPVALQDLLNRVTVQETSFFRDPGQFDALATEVLPRLAALGVPVQVWSAGCANGQEAYSLAMTLAESGITEWEVVATDVSTEALARTKAAQYSEREVRGLTPERRTRHLVDATADGGGPIRWEVEPHLRSRVRVLRHNLVADPPPFLPGACQVVFCRNVLIYFDRANTLALLERVAAWLPPDGWLFLGYSESLWDLPSPFELARVGDAFAYRRTTVATASPGWSPVVPPPMVTPPKDLPPLAEPEPPSPSPSPSPAPTSSPAPTPEPTSHQLVLRGGELLAAGDVAAAIAVLRQATFVGPDDPVAHLNLGLALEHAGDDGAARRAFAAARAALDRCDPDGLETVLEGFHVDELTRLLDHRARRP